MTKTKARWVSFVVAASLLLVLLFTAATVPSIFAEAQAAPRLLLEQVVSSTATQTAVTGVYSAVHVGDTFTVTYKLIENDGLVEGAFTPAFDESAFRLTSFAVDTTYYTLFDNYGHDVVDPQTQQVFFVEMTAAEFIAEHNAALDNGEEPYTSRLSFVISFNGDDNAASGVTSDAFITVTYVSVADLAGTYAFGFDMAQGGMYTNASAKDAEELDLCYVSGEGTAPLCDEMFVIRIKTQVAATVAAGQTVGFSHSGSEYVLDADDILVTFTEPVFTPGQQNPYLEDGGSISFRFYKKIGDGYELIEDGEGNPVLPSAADLTAEIYVKAVFPESANYIGGETPYERIFIAPFYKFRALNAGADYENGLYRNLAWDDVNERFVFADECEGFAFAAGAVIPRAASVSAFRICGWVKAVKVAGEYVYTPVARFESEVSLQVDEDAYYIAQMSLNVGKGDVNGDGFVTAEDVIMMKKALVGVTFTTLADEGAAWASLGGQGLCFYTAYWDVNGDENSDSRDIVAVSEALATGYDYEIKVDVTTADGEYVSGARVVKSDALAFEGDVTPVDSALDFGMLLEAGRAVGLLSNIDASLFDEFVSDGDVTIDLGGKTLILGDFVLETPGKLTVKNGALTVVGSFNATAADGIYFVNVTDGTDPILAAGETDLVLSA